MTFGDEIREYRRKHKLSQSELAIQVGISRNYLSQIERGISDNPSWRIRERLTRMVEFTKTAQCKFCGEVYPINEGHVCYDETCDVELREQRALSDILAELRQIRQMLESRR